MSPKAFYNLYNNILIIKNIYGNIIGDETIKQFKVIETELKNIKSENDQIIIKLEKKIKETSNSNNK